MLTDQHKPSHFAFFTPSKNYHLRADTIEEAESWVTNLRKTVDAAAESSLSSSFKRMGILEAAAASSQSTKPNISYRHSFSPATLEHHQRTQSGNVIPPLSNQNTNKLSQNSNTTSEANPPLNFAKRHTINALDVSKVQKGVAGYNNGVEPNVRLDNSSSKLSKSFGSTTSPGSTRSDYLSSIMTSTDDVQSSLASTNNEISEETAQRIINSSGSSKDTEQINNSSTLSAISGSEGQYPENEVRVEPNEAATLPNNTQQEQQQQQPIDSNEEQSNYPDNDNEADEIPLTKLDQESTVESGYLLKRKKKYNQWKKIWIVLTNKRILIFKNDKVRLKINILFFNLC